MLVGTPSSTVPGPVRASNFLGPAEVRPIDAARAINHTNRQASIIDWLKTMKAIKPRTARPSEDPYGGRVTVHASACYDLLVSLRALFNPRTFKRTRRWGAAELSELGESEQAQGRFFFQSFDTALGYGAARLVEQLPSGASPSQLIEAVRSCDPARLAMFMLDTGETSAERLEQYQRVLNGDAPDVGDVLDGLPKGWARRCRRVLTEPAEVKRDLAAFLQCYLERVFAAQVDSIERTLDAEVSTAARLLEAIPTVDAIEHLTGGYTLSTEFDLHKITLAPSVFAYPFMSTRVDEVSGEALIIYGVSSAIFDSYEAVPAEQALGDALKALSDSNRLTIVGLLAKESMYATDLVKALRLSQPTVHYHLAQLRAVGLIRQRREKGAMHYSVRDGSAREIVRSLERLMLGRTDETDESDD